MRDRYPRFLPQWTNAVKQLYKTYTKEEIGIVPEILINIDSKLDWFNNKCCLVGEAFFHKDVVGRKSRNNNKCERCGILATNDSLFALESVQKLYKYKSDLAKHLQTYHPKTWKRWKSL
jgi:hypothetical protein